MPSLRLSLLAAASVCLLLSACAGGSSGTGTAGSSGGGTGGATGAAGTGSGAAGNGAAGSAGTTGSAGTGGGAAGSGVAGTGVAGIAGTSGNAGTSGTSGAAGASGGRGGTGGGSSAGTGGTAGSSAGGGGTGGQGGSAGAGGRGGTTGSAGTGGATATGFFSDGFESGTNGMQPAGWMNFIAYVPNSPNPSGTTMAVVDSTRAHSGTKSVRVHGGSSPAQLTRALPTGTNKLYVRAWIYLTRQLGLNTGTNHDTLIGIRRNPNGADDEVRFGEVLGAQGKGALGTNVVPSDDFSPRLATVTTATVTPNRWACFEVAFLADQPQHTLYAWVDGTMVHSVTSPTAWEHGNEQMNWLTGRFVQVIIGWQSFSGVDTDLWIDDVVLSTSPIGCN